MEPDLLSEHERDDLEAVEGERALVVGARDVQQQVLHSAHVQRPATPAPNSLPLVRQANTGRRATPRVASLCTSMRAASPIQAPTPRLGAMKWPHGRNQLVLGKGSRAEGQAGLFLLLTLCALKALSAWPFQVKIEMKSQEVRSTCHQICLIFGMEPHHPDFYYSGQHCQCEQFQLGTRTVFLVLPEHLVMDTGVVVSPLNKRNVQNTANQTVGNRYISVRLCPVHIGSKRFCESKRTNLALLCKQFPSKKGWDQPSPVHHHGAAKQRKHTNLFFGRVCRHVQNVSHQEQNSLDEHPIFLLPTLPVLRSTKPKV